MLILLIFIANRRVDVKAKGVTFDGLDTSEIFYQNSEGNKSKFFVPHELRRISPPQTSLQVKGRKVKEG
jgi:hypothetical protein